MMTLARQGLAVARERGESGGGLPVRAMLVADRGLASIRNALLAAALEDPDVTHVAMIDDDEWPEPQWIAALLEMQQKTGADIVGGPVFSAFACTRPRGGSRLPVLPAQPICRTGRLTSCGAPTTCSSPAPASNMPGPCGSTRAMA